MTVLAASVTVTVLAAQLPSTSESAGAVSAETSPEPVGVAGLTVLYLVVVEVEEMVLRPSELGVGTAAAETSSEPAGVGLVA